VQFLPGFGKRRKIGALRLDISSNVSVGQVHADNFCCGGETAQSRTACPVIRSDSPSSPGAAPSKDSQLQYSERTSPIRRAIQHSKSISLRAIPGERQRQFTVAFESIARTSEATSSMISTYATTGIGIFIRKSQQVIELLCCVIQAALNSILLSRSNSGSMPTSPASVPMRSFANWPSQPADALASAAVEISHVRAAYRSGRSLVASNKRPCNIPRKFMRIPSTDRPELPTRCQQIAVGT